MKHIIGILFFIFFISATKAQVVNSVDSCAVFVSSSVNAEVDYVGISCDCKIVKFYFAIYNRWGSPIFESKEFPEDGKLKWDTSNVDTGIYTYKVTYKIDLGNSKKEDERTGKISVIK